MKRISVLAAVLVAIVLRAEEIHAQQSEPGIAATGSTVIECPAERMRLQIELTASSTKDLPDALTRLKALRAKAEKQLASMGAIKESVKFSAVRVDESQDDRQRQIQALMRQRMAVLARGKKPPKQESNKSIQVVMELTADWELQPGDAMALLLSTTKLQDAVRDADLGGLQDKAEASPEEEELAEELAMESPYSESSKPGEPRFSFLAKVPAAEMEKAMTEAFQQARAQAGQLARAAGIELGALRSLQSNSFSETAGRQSYSFFSNEQ